MTSAIEQGQIGVSYCMQNINTDAIFQVSCSDPKIAYLVSEVLKTNCSSSIAADYLCKYSASTLVYGKDSSCSAAFCQYLYNTFDACVNNTISQITETFYRPPTLSACGTVGVTLGVIGAVFLGAVMGCGLCTRNVKDEVLPIENAKIDRKNCSKLRSCFKNSLQRVCSIGTCCRRRNYTQLADPSNARVEEL